MKNTILGLLVAVVATFTLTAAPTAQAAAAAPVEAASSAAPAAKAGDFYRNFCFSETGTWDVRWRACITPTWSVQGDGTGVTLNGVDLTTTDGCGVLESTNPYDPFSAKWKTPAGVTKKAWEWDGEPCNASKSTDGPGVDKGYMEFRSHLKARFDGGHEDLHYYVGADLKVDGTAVVNFAIVSDDPITWRTVAKIAARTGGKAVRYVAGRILSCTKAGC